MIIKCSKCCTAFRIDDNLLKNTGTSFRCSECKQVFKVYPVKNLYHLLENFEYALKRVLKSVEILEEYEKQKAESIEKNKDNDDSASDLPEMLVNLYRLLKKNDLEAEESFNLVKPHLTGSDVQNDLDTLEKYIAHLDFENAMNTLKKIAQTLRKKIE